MDKDGYYLRLVATDQVYFSHKFNTKYRIKNEKLFLDKVKNKEINLLPNFRWNCLGGGILEYCKIKKRYFLTITRVKNVNKFSRNLNTNLLAINYGGLNRQCYKVINDDLNTFNLQKELSSTHNEYYDDKNPKVFNLKEELHKEVTEGQLVNFSTQGVLVVDKSLTFGMGYAITSAVFPIHFHIQVPMEISENIFYSFDEEEIKKKIIEFLSPSYIMDSKTYG